MALFYNMLKLNHFSLWGYGVKPLWNVPLVMGSFCFNFENVHNLYYWFILRTGVAGISAFFYLVFRVFREAWILRKNACAPWCAVVAETIMISFNASACDGLVPSDLCNGPFRHFFWNYPCRSYGRKICKQ